MAPGERDISEAERQIEPRPPARVGFETDRPVQTVRAGVATTEPDRDLFGNVPKDRANWDHRRGEPRWFALMWTVYLMGSAVLSVGSAAGTGLNDQDAYRAGVRILVLTLAGGAAVFWPMVRLSQHAPRQPRRAMLGDLLVITLPTQLLIWPQVLPFLAGWTLGATAVVSLALLGWAAVVGGLLSHALIGEDPHDRSAGRGVWMVVFVLIALTGPGLAWLRGQLSGDPVLSPATLPPAGYLASPITAPWDAIRPRVWTGRAVAVSSWHWIGVVCVWALAAVVWGTTGFRRVVPSRVAA